MSPPRPSSSSGTAWVPPARCVWTPSPSGFAQAGIAALAFTYRHFGDSGGHPRQLLSIKRQLTDWDAAIDYVKARPDVDHTRIAVWGSSFGGGGHAITVASRHPELRAAVAQCPFTDGLASALALGPLASLRITPGGRPAIC
ncbi:prolyl oligopeptidase family serine peptidase [Streptomyces stelliscabiei]